MLCLVIVHHGFEWVIYNLIRVDLINKMISEMHFDIIVVMISIFIMSEVYL